MNKKAILEGLLFVSGDEGLSKDQLLKVLNISLDELNSLIINYENDLKNEERGLCLEIFGDKYKLTTKKEHADYYKALVDEESNDGLSQAALETLAIVAYNQPITRVMIDEIRGVSSVYLVRKLLLKNLIEEKGKSELPGRPILYGVTDQFLDYFGIKSLEELPVIEENFETNDEQELFTSKYKEEV